MAERRMEPAFVVDLLEELRKVFDNILEGFENHRMDRLDLQRLHEALRLGVVIRVASAAHRADQAMVGKELPVDLGGILRAAIGMMDAAWRRLSPIDGSLQRRDRQARIDRAADGVADDQARTSAAGWP